MEITDGAGVVQPPLPASADAGPSATGCVPLIQFVIDTSGSMSWVAGTERVPMSGEQSKWQIAQLALSELIAALPDGVTVGLNFYPNSPSVTPDCYLPDVATALAPLSAELRTGIQQAIQGQVPVGGTPTHAAYAFGVQQLQAATFTGPRFLLLVTDGIPTFTLACGGDGRTAVSSEPLIRDVEAAFRNGIRTLVIGLPGSEGARRDLSLIASAGGTAPPGCTSEGPAFCHFDTTTDPDFSGALTRAFGDSAQLALRCD